MDPIEMLKKRARGRRARIALPEAGDDRIVAAARIAVKESWAIPIFVGGPDEIHEVCRKADLEEDEYETFDCNAPALLEQFASAYVERRAAPMKIEAARRLVKRPLAFGGMLVVTGRADGIVAGARNSSTSVVESLSLTIGPAPGISTPSSFFVMVLPEFRGKRNTPLYFADCAGVIDPNARQLAEIAVMTARSVDTMFGVTPRVALLSFSTRHSSSHHLVDKVAEATRLARQLAPNFEFDGELQVDAAIIPAIAARKGASSAVAGRANVLIFPDLESGNIGYKLVEQLARAAAYGPFMQGLAHPASDLSRGSTVEDIAGTIAVVAAQCVR